MPTRRRGWPRTLRRPIGWVPSANNVTFEGAARRTAQIAHDVQFEGAPIFFSWPSQGGLLKYTVDANNVEWAVPHLRQFLVDVTRRSGATAVNLVAHSMGNRALTSALRELELQLGAESALFNQIILAAPDVDAEIFRRDLAPALVRSARHVTLYASSNDQALATSKKVHG
ncbi:MAG: alpha/beta hydrolase [Pirellulaceae bacterium]